MARFVEIRGTHINVDLAIKVSEWGGEEGRTLIRFIGETDSMTFHNVPKHEYRALLQAMYPEEDWCDAK